MIKSDNKDYEEVKAETWQLDLLNLNPEYVNWGPHQEYMWKLNDKESKARGKEYGCGWESRVILKNWEEFKKGDWTLDNLNECVNFYFSVNRESKECPTCSGSGYSIDAQWVSGSFYQSGSPFLIGNENHNLMNFNHSHGGYPEDEILLKYHNNFRLFCEAMYSGNGYWKDNITQEELDALWDQGRLGARSHPENKPTLEQVNLANRADIKEFQSKFPNCESSELHHDGINLYILIEERCKNFGIPRLCEVCKGKGSVYIVDHAHVSLTLWWIHPRKGASRGIEISLIEEKDLSEIFNFLNEAAKRNEERFSKIPKNINI